MIKLTAIAHSQPHPATALPAAAAGVVMSYHTTLLPLNTSYQITKWMQLILNDHCESQIQQPTVSVV